MIKDFKRSQSNLGAIISSDKSALETYKLHREKNRALLNRINTLEQKIKTLEEFCNKLGYNTCQ